MIRPSLLRYPPVHGTSSTTVAAGLSNWGNQVRRATHLRGNKDVLPRDPALFNGISNLLLVLRSDVSVGVGFVEALRCVRGKPKHRRCDGSQQPELP